MLSAMALVAITSLAILRTRALPRFVAFVAVAASLAFAWYYVPVFALLASTVALSLMLAFSPLRRAPRPRA